MRVQTSPRNRLKSSSIVGYKVQPQHGNTVSIKSNPATRLNYEDVLDDGRQLTQSPTLNLLPLNFCHTPGQYNKLLITNGRKGLIDNQQQENLTAPTVEFLNIDVHKRNQEKQEKNKQIYRIKEQSRVKSTTVELAECNCCCCDNYCKFCSDQMHFNFDNQPILSAVPVVSPINRIKTQKSFRSPVKRVIQLQPEKQQWINRSELARTQKASKRKNSLAFSSEQPQSYIRIKPLLQRSIDKNKKLQCLKIVTDPLFIAQNKVNRIKQYDDQRKRLASTSLNKKQFKPQQPWNYHIPKVIEHDKYCHKHHAIEGFEFKPIKKKVEQDIQLPCHPVSHISPIDMEMHRKLKGQIAYSKLQKEKQQKIQQRIRTSQKLRRLEQERREIIRKTPKQVFKPKQQFLYPLD